MTATPPLRARRCAGAVIAVSALLLLPGCSAPDPVGAAQGARPSTTAGGADAPQAPAASSAPPAPSPVPEQTTAPDGSVPARERPTLAPAAQGEAVQVDAVGAEGISVLLEDVRSVDVAADGPGEVSGPGVAVTVQIRNGDLGPLSLEGFAVSVESGPEAVPAVAAGGGDPVPATLAAGEAARGTYVFLLDGPSAANIRSLVTVSADLPVVVLEGRAPQ